jgi:iron complex outermembrane receptor protein
MKKFKLTPLAAVSLLLSASALAQQTSTPTLQEIVVTASPIIESNNVDNFSGFTTRVTDAQVRDLGALDLAAALRMTPGVQISRYNEVGSYSGSEGGTVYIRGMGVSRPGSEIKTYIDGLPVYMGIWSHPLMDLLPLNGVQSIDIQKGAQPQVSGNNFGAIHLSSKKASKDGLSAEALVSLGSFGTQTAQAHLLGKKDGLDVVLAAGHASSNGDRPNSDGSLSNATGRIGLQLNNAWSVGASFLAVNNEVGDPGHNLYPTSSGGAMIAGTWAGSNGVARNDSKANLFALSVNHVHGDWRGELKVYENQGHNDLSNDPTWGTFNTRFKMSGIRWKEAFTPWAGGAVTAGAEHENVQGVVEGPHVGGSMGLQGSADIPSFKLTSAHVGFSQQVNVSAGWVMVPSLGVRVYDSNIYASRSAPHMGVSFVSEKLTVYANRAKGILYPGAETYSLTKAMPFAFAASSGWNTLAPTENTHNEIGVKWDMAPGTYFDASIFDDLISKRYTWTGYNTTASGAWANTYPDYRIRGAELSLKHQLNAQWSVFGGVTLLDPSISNLPYAPQTAVSVGVAGQVQAYRINLDAQHQSGMFSQRQDRGLGDNNPQPVGAFTVANARIARPMASLGKKGEVFAAMNNIFDASYQYNAGYPMPGRNVRIGLMASF